MKGWLLYFIIVLFYLFTPVCGLAVAGTMVSLKYEVDEARIFNEINRNRTEEEKIKRNYEITRHEHHLNTVCNLWTFGFAFCPITATALLIFRKKLVPVIN